VLSTKTLPFLFCHLVRVTLNAYVADLADTGCPIRLEHQGEEPCHDIVELLALHRVLVLSTVAAGEIVILRAALPHLAPPGFLVVVATGATILQVSTAGSAIQPTIGYHRRIRYNLSHRLRSFIGLKYGSKPLLVEMTIKG
jgi:hypothetical protein